MSTDNIIINGARDVRELTVLLPSSKSLSARALLISALTEGGTMPIGIARCDDTDALRRGLEVTSGTIDVGAAGTAMRFLTAFHAVSERHDVVIDGTERMRQRPIGVLVDALRSAGCSVDYLGVEGFPPVRVKGRKLSGIDVAMRGDVSSQYVSAMMMIAPCCGGGTLRLTTTLTSRPYVEMTAALMRHYGAEVTVADDAISVGTAMYTPREYAIEPDWSAAGYWLAVAALMPGMRVTLPGLSTCSLQGDARLVQVMSSLGVTTSDNGTMVVAEHSNAPQCACPLAIDLADMPDAAQTIVVTACLLGRRFNITGLGTLRIKETDRLQALCDELRKVGYILHATTDSISWDGARSEPLTTAVIDTYKDHRMAMSMSLAGLRRRGIVITDAGVVSKSYPDYWDEFARVANVAPYHQANMG